MAQLDTADRQRPSDVVAAKMERPREKIAWLGEEMRRLDGIQAEMLSSPDQHVFPTEPDAHSMSTSGRDSAYRRPQHAGHGGNLEHHLTVAQEVTNDCSDQALLSGVATQAKAALGAEMLDAAPTGQLLGRGEPPRPHRRTGFSGRGFGLGLGAGRLTANLVTGARPVVVQAPSGSRDSSMGRRLCR